MMAQVFIFIKMETNMKDNLKKDLNMDKEHYLRIIKKNLKANF